MQERPQNFDEAGDDSEVTLAAPRFDADEARQASPVVPLEEIPTGRRAAAGRARFRAGARRWPLSFVVVALLAVATLGAVAASVLRRAHTATPAHISADAAQEQQPPRTDTAPAQTAAPQTRADASAPPQSAPAQTAASEEKSGEDKAEGRGEEKSEVRAPLRAREGRAARHRGEAVLPPVAERGEVDGEGVERGEHHGRHKGDDRDEERGDRDYKKDSKRQKGGARLVDVLVGRPRP